MEVLLKQLRLFFYKTSKKNRIKQKKGEGTMSKMATIWSLNYTKIGF